jgi:hypothetical protein
MNTGAGGAVAGALLAGVIAGCGGGSHAPTPGERLLIQQNKDYAKDYSRTTCRQYETTLTEGERTAAAAQALIRLRANDGLPAPSDAGVSKFEAGIDGACQAIPSQSLVHAVVFVYQH